MYNREATSIDDCRAVDTKTLMKILDSGRKASLKIGTAAGARIQVGRRVLWNLKKIEKYLNEVSQ